MNVTVQITTLAQLLALTSLCAASTPQITAPTTTPESAMDVSEHEKITQENNTIEKQLEAQRADINAEKIAVIEQKHREVEKIHRGHREQTPAQETTPQVDDSPDVSDEEFAQLFANADSAEFLSNVLGMLDQMHGEYAENESQLAQETKALNNEFSETTDFSAPFPETGIVNRAS